MTTGCTHVDKDENEVPGRSTKRKANENMKCKIPRLYRKSMYGDKKSDVFYTKGKKPLSKNSSFQNLLLNLDAQVKINQNILDLEKRTGLSMVQKNGQRKLGPPPDWTGPPPGSDCEVFVGRLPRNIYEDVIYPIFNSVGKVYEIRLMMNFSGTNRGFCFIMFTKPEYANRAITELNNHEICPGWCIGVVASVNNCRLHVTELPSNIDVRKLIKKIWLVCEDVDKVSFYINTSNPKVKHALITFKTHRSAAMARRRLLPDQGSFFEKSDVRIEWAHPKMLISDALEESGYCDENGKIVIITKQLQTNKKIHNTKKKSDQNFKTSTTAVTNVQAANHIHKAIPQNNCTNRSYNNKTQSRNKNQNVCKVDCCNKNYYVEQSINNNTVQQFDVNQNVYRKDDVNSIDGPIKCYDHFKYSIRSDESLSDFSKSSDLDDSKHSYSPINTSTPYRRIIPPYLNPSNCSVVQIPWGYYPVNQTPNSYHGNINFHTVRFPWHLMKVVSSNSGHTLVNMIPTQNHVITNYAIPHYVANNVKNIEPFRSFHGIIKNARPILNRKTLTY